MFLTKFQWRFRVLNKIIWIPKRLFKLLNFLAKIISASLNKGIDTVNSTSNLKTIMIKFLQSFFNNLALYWAASFATWFLELFLFLSIKNKHNPL